MFQQPAIGIELGDGALKAVKLERSGARHVITFAEYRPYARPEDGAARPRAGLDPRAFAALQEFLAGHRPSPFSRVYVGMPSIAAFNKLVRVPDVGAKQLLSIADYELHRSVRGPIEDYVVRTRVPRAKGDAAEVPCMLFTVRRTLRDAFVSDLARAGLEFDMLVPSPVALAQFARYDRPAKGDRIVVSIGLRATEVVYERDRAYCFRTLPLGVVGLAAIPVERTEKRKRAAKRLVDKICYEIGAGAGFFFGEDGNWDPKSVCLFGEGASEPEIVDEFERHYSGLLETIGSLNRIAISASCGGDGRAHVARMGSALGLAIQAARADETEIELCPPNLARAASRRVPALAAFAVVLAAVCGAMTWRDVSTARSATQLAAIDIEAGALTRRLEFEKVAAEFEAEQRRGDAMAALLRGRVPRASVLGSVVSQFGPAVQSFGALDCRLRTLTVERSQDGATISGEALVHQGDYARAVSVVKERLQVTDPIATVTVAPAVGPPASGADPGLPRMTFEAQARVR